MMKQRKLLTNRKFETVQSQRTKLYPNFDGSILMRSCEEEVTTPIVGVTQGTIPKWLNGSLLRNGPGAIKVNDMQFEHMFDSLALIHKYVLGNRFQCSNILIRLCSLKIDSSFRTE